MISPAEQQHTIDHSFTNNGPHTKRVFVLCHKRSKHIMNEEGISVMSQELNPSGLTVTTFSMYDGEPNRSVAHSSYMEQSLSVERMDRTSVASMSEQRVSEEADGHSVLIQEMSELAVSEIRSFTMASLDHSVEPMVHRNMFRGSHVNAHAVDEEQQSPNQRYDFAPEPAAARLEETRAHGVDPNMVQRTVVAAELSPLIVKITNAAPSADGLAPVVPGFIGDVIVYIFGDDTHHRTYKSIFKATHKMFVRTEHVNEKRKLAETLRKVVPTLIQQINKKEGMFMTEHGLAMNDRQATDLLESFLKQTCYVDFDPDTDVGGSGKTASLARGHQQYLEQARAWSPGYADPNNNSADKRFIAQELVDFVHEQGGQFVRHCTNTNQYYLLNNEEAIYKARQCFRDRIKESKRCAAANAAAATSN
jgi:hypothetical protein